MSKTNTPHKQGFVNPEIKHKTEIKEKNQQKLVSTPDTSREELPFIDSQYDLLEIIGSGGMGTVYKASDKQNGKLFAIKVLRPDLALDQSSLKRFEQEIEATLGLTHPHLVPTLAHGRTPDGAPYLVMEYIEGESLSTILKREGRLSSDRVLKLLTQICDGLTYAHERGIIHRDIKPTNIVVSKNENGLETARLVDFGIAKILTAQNRETHDLTETGAVFGNPYYMSPEHCLSLKMDERSDIYSLGCLIYDLITGNPPFPDSNPVHVIVKHINDEAKSFSADYRTDVTSERLNDVTLRCLEKEPERRYQSVGALAADLELISEGKKPAKYVPRKKARPEFTRTQIVAGSVAVTLFINSRAMTGGWSDQFLIFVILAFVGCLVFSYASFARLKSIFKGNITPRNVWRALLFISLASICSFSIPDNLYILYAEHLPWLTPYTQIVALALKLTVASAVISTIGCLAFRSTIKIPAWKCGMQVVGVACAVILAISAAFPKWTSEELTHCCMLGRMVEVNAPWVTDGLRRYAIVLDPANKSAVYSLSYSLSKRSQFNEAEAVLNNYLKNVTDKETLSEVFFRRSKIYKMSDKPEARIEDLNRAIQLSPRFDYFIERASCFWEIGRNGQALKCFDEATVSQPGSVAPYCGKALVYASKGDYPSAIKELNQMAKLEDQQISVFFLRGLLRAKSHDPSATDDFRIVIQRDLDPKKRSQQGLSICEVKLRTAYAYKALGDNANFLNKLDEAKRYSYGEFERVNKELQDTCKRANREL